MQRRTRREVISHDECWFNRITSALAKRQPKYAPFIGSFLVTECTDHLEQGAIVTDVMIFAEKMHHQRLSRQQSA